MTTLAEFKKAVDEMRGAIGQRLNDQDELMKSAVELVKEQQETMEAHVLPFVKRTNEFIDACEDEESKGRSPARGAPAGLSGVDSPEVWRNLKTGQPVKLYGHKDRLSATIPNRTGVSLGRWMRGILVGKYMDDVKELGEEAKALATSPDASGGYSVPAALRSEFIDLMRNQLVLSKAGAQYVPMEEKTVSLVKLLQDAQAEWHGENANVNASDPSLGLVRLDSKTIVALTKFSLELSQDSINIEAILQRSLTSALAQAIDAAGLGNTTTNGPSGIMSFGSRNRVTGLGALTSYDPFLDGMGKLLDANVPLDRIGDAVIHSRAWTALQKLTTGISGDKTKLTKPASVPPFLVSNGVAQSTGSPTGSTGYLADWRDLLYGVRHEIDVRILREAFLGSNLQIAMLVYARVDFAATREQSFCTLEDIAN